LLIGAITPKGRGVNRATVQRNGFASIDSGVAANFVEYIFAGPSVPNIVDFNQSLLIRVKG
jgi:hypothetical protein